jgi:iron(III) transport system ATP-binding protein
VLEVTNLIKSYSGMKIAKDGTDVRAVKSVSLKVEPGELFTMLGPSGCGKTTTLRCIAGLEIPDSGEIVVGDRTLYSSSKNVRLRAYERGLGMVFQSYAIWPHLNVFRNVAFPLEVIPRKHRLNRKQIKERVERALSVVRLDHLADRQSTKLSGGQQQRLALARALVMEPPILLLDEPLSNLDAKLRDEMRFELKRLQRELGLTAVYVTHDQSEALSMSDNIAVMRDGLIEQVGKPRDIYQRPVSRFVADFIGNTNLLDGKVTGRDGEWYEVDTDHGRMLAMSPADHATRASVTVAIRPEYIELEKGHNQPARPNLWHGTVKSRAFFGEAVDHVITVNGIELRSRTNAKISLPEGTDVTLKLDQTMCTLIAD